MGSCWWSAGAARTKQVGVRLDLPAMTWAQLPPPQPEVSGTSHPWPGWAWARQAGARGWRDALSTQCTRAAVVGASVSPVSAQPRRVPGCSPPRLLFPQSVNPSICYSAQLPGWGSSLPRASTVPLAAHGTRVWGKFSFQASQRDQVESPRSWKPLECCHQNF